MNKTKSAKGARQDGPGPHGVRQTISEQVTVKHLTIKFSDGFEGSVVRNRDNGLYRDADECGTDCMGELLPTIEKVIKYAQDTAPERRQRRAMEREMRRLAQETGLRATVAGGREAAARQQ